MNAKAVVVIVILLVLIGGGAFYAGQKYKLVPASQPVLPSTQTVLSTPTPLPQVPGTPVNKTATPTTTPVDETAAVLTMVKASEVVRIGADANTETYTVTQIQGNYAKGTAGGTGGGAQWFAAKVGGVWKLVFIGNGTVQCSDLTNYPNYPAAWIPECWDAAAQKTVTR